MHSSWWEMIPILLEDKRSRETRAEEFGSAARANGIPRRAKLCW